MPVIIKPESEAHWLKLRTEDVTSTESAALFGLSPYATAFELWHRKKSGEVPEFHQNERMVWGTRLQDAIARGIADDHGWTVRKLNTYMRHTDTAGMGSSFDFEIVSHDDGPGILEIKAVDFIAFRDNWLVDGDKIEAPEHIEIQLQHQLEVANREWGVIGALIGGNTVRVLTRKRDREVGAALRRAVENFWMSINLDQEPKPVYPQDAEMVCSLHQYAEPGKIYDAQGNAEIASLVAEYHQAGADERDAKERKETAKARILSVIGDAERVLLEGFSVSAGVVGPAMIEAYERKGYRNFRVTAKKHKVAA